MKLQLKITSVVACLITVLYPSSLFAKPTFSTKADLNGDGKVESISLSQSRKNDGNFTLKIGDSAVTGKLHDMVEDMRVVDIDKKDQFKEIAVYTSGPSDDFAYALFWYDGKHIHKVAQIGGSLTFQGNGIVINRNFVGFWVAVDKYVLNSKTRTLNLVPQEFYYVGENAKVIKSFPIYMEKKSSTVLAQLRPDSKLVILLTYPSARSNDIFDEWYLIKTESGLLGWARLGSFYELVSGLNWAD